MQWINQSEDNTYMGFVNVFLLIKLPRQSSDWVLLVTNLAA